MIEDILRKLPAEPGVYMYFDANGTVIYVGKARILKNRVRSYFHSHDLNVKTQRLVSNIADIKYIVTANELEALLLENNLIKKYKPKYNIMLKDDKGYPYLRIDTREAYPRLTVARKMKFDGAKYFGPYHGSGSAKAIMDIALDLFPLATCGYDLSKHIRPCLKCQIGKCPAPCKTDCTNEYRANVNGVIAFLKGESTDSLDKVYNKMTAASDRLEFELAAELRDKLKKASEILNRQKIVLDRNEDSDVIAAVVRDTYTVVCSMYIRSGRLIGVNTEEAVETLYENESQILAKYIIQHYGNGAIIPKEIICATVPDDKEIIEELLSGEARRKVTVLIPQKGKKFELCKMAQRNAREKLEKSSLSLSYRDERIIDGLNGLQKLLNTDAPPKRIECFDISHIQGTDTVASMTVFTNGRPDKKQYRHFKTHQGNNDFASMREVTLRRYTDLINKKPGFENEPDLIVIDGGIGQLNSACEAIRGQLNYNKPIIGLTERIEEIYLPGQTMPRLLRRSDASLQILQAIRDEAHRFAITFHRSLRGKRLSLSELDNIEGVGKARKKALLNKFSSVSRIKNATLEQLKAVEGINATTAENIYNYFRNSES